jgi:uncharacterized protein with PQ loop repeat
MTLASLVGPIAAAMGVLMALSPLLQARRIRIARDSSEVSSGVFAVMRVNASAWLLYGFATANVILVLPNLVALLTTTATLYTIRRHRPAVAPASTPDAPPRDVHSGRIRVGAASVARAGRRLAFARR